MSYKNDTHKIPLNFEIETVHKIPVWRPDFEEEKKGKPRGVTINVRNCDIEGNELKLRSRYHVHIWTNAPWERYESFCLTKLWVK